ncbi:hypothetical protein IWX65_001760 [Arthrobacter sp. CAN_A214]|uniref:LysM peptidoglycan-binding domain-containing protein n=1 Tax=Arthrobacter sp. CAN_A214 TaxID=2787720 RepID=UPI0018C94C43
MAALTIVRTSTPLVDGNRSNDALREVVADRPSPSTKSAPIHLTRRGRLVLVGLPTVLLVALVLIFGVSLTSQAKAMDSEPAPTETINVSVGQGETLWGLAGEFAPDRDPREFVAELVELNGLKSSVVQAGQSLAVPVGG